VPQIVRNADAVLWVIDLGDDDVHDRLEETRTFLSNAHVDLEQMKVLIVCNKSDAAGAEEREAIVREVSKNRFPMTTFSAAGASSDQIGRFKGFVYHFLDVVRVYTKAPGKKPDFNDPYVVARGSRVLDVAEKVHRDFVDNLKYARIWGEGKADGIMVPRDFVVSEGDVLELHT
jgi:ribosome-interacting GTPase 1